MILRKDEEKLIQLLRSCRRYSSITIEKRPSKTYPDGELSRAKVEESFLLEEIMLEVAKRPE